MESCPSGRRSTIGNRVDGQRRLKGSNPLLSAIIFGPLVKRLRHRPFTAVTRVRIPYGSPKFFHESENNIPFEIINHKQLHRRISSAGRASALQAEGRRFDPVILHHLYFLTYSYVRKNLIIIIAGWSSSVARRAHNPKVAGSNPVPATKWSRGVAVNMPACHAGDRRFDPGRDRHFL